MKYLIFVILLVAVLITAGCTSEKPNVVAAPTITTIQTTIPTTIPTTIQTTIPTITPNVTKMITVTPTVKPTVITDVTDVNSIRFTRWSGELISMDIPNTWTVDKTGYYSTTFSPPSKAVTYKISQFGLGSGNWEINRGNQWYYDLVSAEFPKYDARSITGVTIEKSIAGVDSKHAAKYTVTTPEVKLFRYIAAKGNVGYEFELMSTSPSKFDAYENLGEYMTNTITIP